MFFCFKNTRYKPQVLKPTEDNPEVITKDILGHTLKKEAPVVSLIVGHNALNQGAKNYLGESEYVFNLRVAKKVAYKLSEDHNICTAIIKRPPNKSYTRQVDDVRQQLKEIECYFAIELHFNAAVPEARGCEVLLIDRDSFLVTHIALEFARLVNKKLGIPIRHQTGVKVIGEGHNGYGMMRGLKDDNILSMIVEPAFASNRHDAKALFENEDKYVDILVKCICKVVIAKKENKQ